MTELRDEILRVRDAELSFDIVEGAGTTVVGLHGLGSSRASEVLGGYFDWSPVSEQGRRLVRYDARGHGRSTGRPEPSDYVWSNLAYDLLAVLDAVSPDEPVDAFGVSMGVGTLLHAVTKRPDRFRRIALVIPPTAWATRAAQSGAYRQVAAVAEQQGADALREMMHAAPPLPILASGGWSVSTPPDVADDLLSAVMRGAADTDFPNVEAVEAITHPVLVCPWVDDPAHPLDTSEQLHHMLRNSVLEVSRTPADLRTLAARVRNFFD